MEPKDLTIKANIIDISAWEEQLEEAESLQEVFGTMEKRIVGGDLFTALYRLRPEVREDAPSPSRARIMRAAMETAAYQKLHASCALDEVLSAGGTLAMREHIDEEAPEISEALKRAEAAEKYRQLAEAAKEVGSHEQEGKYLDMAQKAEAIAQKKLEQYSDQQLRQTLSRALKKANKNIENAEALAKGWGAEPGELKKIALDKNLLEALSTSQIKKVLDLVGKLKQAISAHKATRPLPAPDEIEITMGAELAALIPSETVMLTDPDLEPLFLRKYIEHSLLQYERKEKPKLAKGPFIMCVDESGSMNGVKEQWAKALALALGSLARQEKRVFGLICFSSKDQQRTWLNPKLNDMVEFLSWSLGGGTNFEKPLTIALDWIGQDDGFRNADILFLTDGQAACSQKFLDELTETKKKKGVRIVGVQLDYIPPESLLAFCDTAYRLDVERGNLAENTKAILIELERRRGGNG